jgi:amidohydrolase
MTEQEFFAELVALRRDIHRHPELGNDEHRTAALIQRKLRSAGVAVKRVARTGLVGTLAGTGQTHGAKKRTMALRGDMDALPIQEATGKPYASTCPGVMHACGHDANSTMVLGAALLLARQAAEFSGTIKFIFQPNEESSGGARDMIAAGVLRNPAVDAIAGIHVSPWLPCGTLGIKQGAMMAAVDRFTIEIIGDGGHGAYPHLAKDAIVCAAQLVTALQTVVAREIDPTDPAVITIGTLHGGERFNIVCGKVTLTGTVRTLNARLHRSVRAMMERKIRGITAAYGARYTFTYEELGNPLVNTPAILEHCRLTGERVLGRGKVMLLEKPSMGGEDFAEYLQQVPGCFLYIGSAVRRSYPWHHEKFDIDERVLPQGARLLAAIAKDYVNNPAQ